MRYSVIYIAIGMLLVGSSCGRMGSHTGSALEPVLGSVDIPKRGATFKDTMTTGGWAVAESGVDRIAIYVDKQFMTFASLDGKRPDIAKMFAKFPNAGDSGWGAIVDLSSLIEGDHEMLMQVKTKSGNIHDFPPVPFKIAR